jgi:hypothetical protein
VFFLWEQEGLQRRSLFLSIKTIIFIFSSLLVRSRGEEHKKTTDVAISEFAPENRHLLIDERMKKKKNIGLKIIATTHVP